ncbi:MAG: hypothetical protein FI717_02065 [SAR202 cluster bacterium]|nr:hypothetical protein [SAR202 cluster bacterium]HCP24071.1 hypothetical protein [Dehalococcoidia bacterium]
MISKRVLFWLALVLTPVLLAACSDTSASLGQFHEGRILVLNVVQFDETDELLYSTIDPEDVVRRWRMQPSQPDLELVLMRVKVQNHIAVSAIFEADEQAAVLRDFFENDYRPISINGTIQLDRRGDSEANISVESGRCDDHPRLVVNAGTNVVWSNTGESNTGIQFSSGGASALGDGLVEIAPGASVSNRFDRVGVFSYQCSGGEDEAQNAVVIVEDAASERGKRENNIQFLEGPFTLPKGTGVDGWMIFEAPKDTKFRDLRWRAGDSITIRF